MLQLQPSPLPFVEVRRRFGFRSIEMAIGHLCRTRPGGRAVYQALVDLMQTLRVPEAVISLRGQLGLQYGIGGRPGVAAHYIPATWQLALAKNAGAGSPRMSGFMVLITTWATKPIARTTKPVGIPCLNRLGNFLPLSID